jgi:hypothetical protein
MGQVNANEDQLRAIEVLKALITDAEGRRAFMAGKGQAFDDMKSRLDPGLQAADYNAIPDDVRAVLEALSPSELALLSDLDAAFVNAGISADLPEGASGIIF